MKTSKKFLFAAAGLSLTNGIPVTAQNNIQDRKPNVIYVFPDQFRNHAMGFWGEKGFKEHVRFKPDPVITPNLNNFARESVVLTSAMSNCPLSSPHRGMLLSGMYPDGSGVPLNCNSDRPISSLREDIECIGDVFKKNGYDCAYIVKLHVDYPTPNNPEAPGTYVNNDTPVWDAYTPKERRHGFDYWYSYGTFDIHKQPHYWDTDGKRHEIREWSPKHEADKAIEYLENTGNVRDTSKPFFMIVSMNPPHSPYRTIDDVMEEDYNLYKDIPLDKLLVRPNANPQMEKAQCAPFYFASVTGVDREFGRILKALKDLGLEENTIVVFSSDHGETMCSQNTNDPKNSPYAESMNVPFLVRYPEKLKPRVEDRLLLSSPDIMPTVLGLAGLSRQIPETVQGTNFAPVISKEKNAPKLPSGVLYLRNLNGEKNADGKIISYFPEARGIKTERYTLAISIDKQHNIKHIFFYDDIKDPYQMNNLSITENQKIFEDLCRQMGQLLKQVNDPWYKDRILSSKIPY